MANVYKGNAVCTIPSMDAVSAYPFFGAIPSASSPQQSDSPMMSPTEACQPTGCSNGSQPSMPGYQLNNISPDKGGSGSTCPSNSPCGGSDGPGPGAGPGGGSGADSCDPCKDGPGGSPGRPGGGGPGGGGPGRPVGPGLPRPTIGI